MDFSIIIPTVGRASLARAVNSGLEQGTASAFEIVVVNDSGKPLDQAGWQKDTRVRVLETARVERSAARNAGAKVAAGEWLIFLDDDDWQLPGAPEQFVRAANGAEWLLGDTQMMSPRGKLLTTVQFPREGNCAVQAMAGEWLPLPSMCIRRDLFWQVGGFRPISLGEDRELASRLALHADLKRVHAPVSAVLQNARVSTSVYTKEQTHKYWELRDALLDQPHAFARLQASARDAYWRGRLARLYLNATLLHVKQFHFGAVLARLQCAGRAFFVYDAVLHATTFWRGALRAHIGSAQ